MALTRKACRRRSWCVFDSELGTDNADGSSVNGLEIRNSEASWFDVSIQSNDSDDKFVWTAPSTSNVLDTCSPRVPFAGCLASNR